MKEVKGLAVAAVVLEVRGVGVEEEEEEEGQVQVQVQTQAQAQAQAQVQEQEQVQDFELPVKERGSTHLGRLVCRNARSTTGRCSWRNNNGLDKIRHTLIDNYPDTVH